MATLAARRASVRLGSTIIAELGEFKLTMGRDEIDTTAFQSTSCSSDACTWKKSDVGFANWSATFSGFYDPSDTAGQGVIEDRFIDGALITNIRFYVNCTNYWTPDLTNCNWSGARITGYNIGASKAGVASLDITVSGTGPIIYV